MKVHELKEILNNYDDTADVFFFTGYSTIPYYELLDRQEVFNSGTARRVLLWRLKQQKDWIR